MKAQQIETGSIVFIPKTEIDVDGIILGVIIVKDNMDFNSFHSNVIKLIETMMTDTTVKYYIDIDYNELCSTKYYPDQYIATIEFGKKLTKAYIIVKEGGKTFDYGAKKGDKYELWIVFP